MSDTTYSGQYWRHIVGFGERLFAGSSLQEKSRIIIDFIQSVIDCRAFVLLCDTSEDKFDSQIWNYEDLPHVSGLHSIIKNVIESRRTIFINHLHSSERESTNQYLDDHEFTSINVIVAPISFIDNLFGVCIVLRSIDAIFLQQDADFLQFIASYSASIIFSQAKDSSDRTKSDILHLVSYVGSQITHIENLDELSERIVLVIQKTFDYYYVAIFTIESGYDVLRFRKSAGKVNSTAQDFIDKHEISEDPLNSLKIDVRIGEGIIGKVAQDGKEIIANNVNKNPYYQRENLLPETKSEAALPIRIGDNILGVLDVQSDSINAFQDADLLVLRGLSDNIAVAIENSRLYIDLQMRLIQLRSIYDVSNAITSILPTDELLEQVRSLMQLNLGYSSVHFYLIDPVNGDIIYQNEAIDHNDQIAQYDFHLSMNDDHNSVAWAARNQKHLLIADFSKEPSLLPITSANENIRSALIVPLMFADKLLGILEIRSDQPNDFDEDDLFIVEALADNIAVALRNSNLYRSEQWRRQVADSLREVAGLLSADVSLDQVLNSILSELINTIPSVFAVIWLKDDVYDDAELIPEMRLSALKGVKEYISLHPNHDINPELLLGSTVDELIETYNLDESIKSWLIDVIDSKKPIVRDSKIPFEPIGALFDLDEDYSAIAAPLRIGDRSMGVLALIHDISGRYGENSQLLSATFANYAAVAIENTRLYEAAHDQAWVSTVLLQVSQAMQSIDSLDELLQTIVHILPDLITTSSCAILLWDDDIGSFIPGMASGFTQQQTTEFENWYIAEFEVPAFDRLRETKAPILIDKSGLLENNQDTFFKSFDFVNGLYMLFPMITKNQVIGAILVDFLEAEHEIPGEISLWEEKISIIQGVANQAAIAIDNLQLIRTQEEEAYITIALLQVAQAVVNSNNLDEILSAIVRITPILVGVRRSIIYLWDEPRAIYRSAQSYGFSRDELAEMQPFYSPREFPLLDYVQKFNTTVFIPESKPLEPNEWAGLESPDQLISESFHGVTDQKKVQQELLHGSYPLIIGIPLAVKDHVVGIMVIEEVEQKSAVPSAHIREKRMEIVTGISQQAAIAIQNDILQRDVLERERLEREMQLAREIQSSFLPDQLPLHEGWDLDIRWRPARQVGGDFYDIFELPNNHIGILIADVADKGMPAALYMTLVRTLIRAAIHETQSPKEVLRRVNDLLVPDSRQGMFVTLVYAVLSLDTGELSYTNAGHNPPLSWKSSTGEISEHVRDAMALGVTQEMEFNESKYILEPGDLFLLYTDGITEAFSTMDEFFGLDRLKEIVQNSEFDSATSLLDQIEASVWKFSDGLLQSDDVTLVAVFRKFY